MAQSGRVRKAAARNRPLRDANFVPKRERKALRKSMIRAYLANRIADARNGAADRADFYRNLRLMKMRRRAIASEFSALEDMVGNLLAAVYKVADRNTEANPRLVNEAIDETKVALSSVSTAADEFHLFSRRRMYYPGGS